MDDMPRQWDQIADAADRLRDGISLTAAEQEVLTQLAEEYGITEEAALDKAIGLYDEKQTAAKEAGDAEKEAADEAREAQEELDKSIRETIGAWDEAAAASEAFGTALEQAQAGSELDFSLMAANTVGSFDAMKESLLKLKAVGVDWGKVDLSPDSLDELRGMPDELAAVTQLMAGMRDTIGTELQLAFDTGGINAYTAKAQFFRDQILAQFPGQFRAMGASEAEASRPTQELLDDLELLPSDVEVQVRLTRLEEARLALDEFGSIIDQLPEERQIAIRTAVAEGDVEAALTMLNEELIERGYPPITLAVDTDTAERRRNGAQLHHERQGGHHPAGHVGRHHRRRR